MSSRMGGSSRWMGIAWTPGLIHALFDWHQFAEDRLGHGGIFKRHRFVHKCFKALPGCMWVGLGSPIGIQDHCGGVRIAILLYLAGRVVQHDGDA